MNKYQVKIKLNGSITYVEVLATNAGRAKDFVLAQYGDKVVILQAILK